MARTSIRSLATRSASWSSVVTASPDATVCRWQSTRTSPLRMRGARPSAAVGNGRVVKVGRGPSALPGDEDRAGRRADGQRGRVVQVTVGSVVATRPDLGAAGRVVADRDVVI